MHYTMKFWEGSVDLSREWLHYLWVFLLQYFF